MERTIISCDVCGKPAVVTLVMKVNGQTTMRHKDLCQRDLDLTLQGSYRPKRGRRAAHFA